MPLPTIAVLMGGPDAEREVSLMSGREIAAALRQSGRFDVHDLVIDAPTADELRALLPKNTAAVFPIVHGRWGEGGPLQQLLEELRIPYVGSRPKAAFLAMDKLATKTLVNAEGVPTPRSRELMPGDTCDIEAPLVLKPVDDGSSVDLRICRTPAEVTAARAELHPKRPRLMAESYIKGREITAGILHGQPLPLIEILPAVEFYDYQAKYFRDDTRYQLNPQLPVGLDQWIKELAIRAFNVLGCRDVARADFMLDERGPWFLEINTLPGFTTHSLVPMAARAAGVEMPELCAQLVETAIARGPAGARPTLQPAATRR
jgi:D-alanine-D-alanine ligase